MKKTSAIFSLLYFLSLVASFYTLYQLPAYLVKSQAVDLIQLEEAQLVFYQTNAILALSFVLGGIALGCLWLRRTSSVAAASLPIEGAATATAAKTLDQDEETNEPILVKEVDELLSFEGDEETVFTQALTQLCRKVEASLAAAYRTQHADDYAYLELFASYAYSVPEGNAATYRFGEGLAGQVAKQGSGVFIDEVPDGYIKILSGLGRATPTYLMIHPLKCDERVVGVVEIASFTKFTPQQKEYVEVSLNRLALKLENIDNVSLPEATH